MGSREKVEFAEGQAGNSRILDLLDELPQQRLMPSAFGWGAVARGVCDPHFEVARKMLDSLNGFVSERYEVVPEAAQSPLLGRDEAYFLDRQREKVLD
jgi:cyanophycinase-like exopeptidase